MFTAELALLDQLDEGKFVEGLSDLGEMDFSSMRFVSLPSTVSLPSKVSALT